MWTKMFQYIFDLYVFIHSLFSARVYLLNINNSNIFSSFFSIYISFSKVKREVRGLEGLVVYKRYCWIKRSIIFINQLNTNTLQGFIDFFFYFGFSFNIFVFLVEKRRRKTCSKPGKCLPIYLFRRDRNSKSYNELQSLNFFLCLTIVNHSGIWNH